MTRRRSHSEDDEIIFLDSIGTPALSSAVPATLRLLRSEIDKLRKGKPQLVAHTGAHNGQSGSADLSRTVSNRRDS